jgi:polyhydroxyalkanoate synthesis repressor PhaR
MKYYKKYPNRRLYDIAASCYVTVDDLRIAIAAGESISVVDSKTEKDLTRNVLLQVISEQEGEGHQPILTNRVLEHLIRFYGDTMNNLVSRYIEQSIISFIEQQELYNKRIKSLSDAEPVAMIKKALEQNIEFWTNMAAPKAPKAPQSTRKRKGSSK